VGFEGKKLVGAGIEKKIWRVRRSLSPNLTRNLKKSKLVLTLGPLQMAHYRTACESMEDGVYRALTHIVNISTIKVQLFGNLVVGQIQPHKIKAQYLHFKGLVMSGKNGPGEIIEAFSARFAFVALFGRFSIIVTFFDCVYGTTKRTLTYFWPTQLTNGFIALYIIYQGLDIYLHRLQAECNQL
jgi:hypothetical protein